jgi:hypothetical protein
LTKGIELVGFRYGTTGDGDDRQGYRGSAGNCRAVIISGATSQNRLSGKPAHDAADNLIFWKSPASRE